MAMQDVLDAALQLPSKERGELAEKLLESLGDDGAEDRVDEKFEYEAEWTNEIDRRMKEIREGRAKLVDGEEVLARAYARVEAARRRG